jgi:hypothetical protein
MFGLQNVSPGELKFERFKPVKITFRSWLGLISQLGGEKVSGSSEFRLRNPERVL